MAPKTDFPPVRACLFDMDGLLLDTEDLYTRCINTILSQHGRPNLPWSIKAKLQGRPGPEATKLFMDWAQLDVSHELYAKQLSAEQRKIFPSAGILPGVEDLLASLGRTRYWDVKRQREWPAGDGPGANAKGPDGQEFVRTAAGCLVGDHGVRDPEMEEADIKFHLGLSRVYSSPQERELDELSRMRSEEIQGGSTAHRDTFGSTEGTKMALPTYPFVSPPPPGGPDAGTPRLFYPLVSQRSPDTAKDSVIPRQSLKSIALYPKRRWAPGSIEKLDNNKPGEGGDATEQLTKEGQGWIKSTKKWEEAFMQQNGRRVHIALATSSHVVNFKLKTSHLEELFSVFPDRRRVLGDDKRLQAGRGKPFPDIFLLALRTINDSLPHDEPRIKPEECLVFEDSVPGVEAGRRAGMRVIWVPHEGLKKEYEGRFGEVLAGATGEAGLDLPLPGEVDDGWAEYLPTLENFPYEKYGMRIPPVDVDEDPQMVESDPKLLAEMETDETRLASSIDMVARVMSLGRETRRHHEAEAAKLREWWDSLGEVDRAKESLRYYDMVIEDIRVDKEKSDENLRELEKRTAWFEWNINEAGRLRKEVEDFLAQSSEGETTGS